jgi:hypothetical protein
MEGIMKTILTSILAGTLLATLATAQPTPQQYRRRVLPYSTAQRADDQSVSAGERLLVYVITGGLQFGAVELRSGSFLPIGPGLPPDVGSGLIPGRGTHLLTLAFSGNLDAIDPATGKTSLVGATGLGDCSTPASPCQLNSANVIGRLDGRFYATDFANNLYSVDPVTGKAKLIGHTGVPPLTFIPFSANPDGSVNVYGESLFSAHGKLYAYFATQAVNFATGAIRTLIPGALYQIDPSTGHTRFIAPTDSSLSSIVNVNGTVYGFDAAAGEVVTLDLTNGQTKVVSKVDAVAGVIVGATPAHPFPGDDH